jgi:uncharacterized peroxidase-related enzyme
MSHMQPLSRETHPELIAEFELMESILGFVPNSVLTMQRKPGIVRGFAAMTRGVMDPEGEVSLGFKRLIAHMASMAVGCQYCEAHSLVAARIHGISDEKLAQIIRYEESDLYTDAEKAALEFALSAAAVPNMVTAKSFERMRKYWNEGQIVEILGVVALYGFLNRWNDTMATDLESTPKAMGEKVLAARGWNGGKHLSGQ